jgi:integrase/recombinase XerD
MAGKQAKILNSKQIKLALTFISNTRHPNRNRILFLLSCKAGLRAIEISNITWSMVTESDNSLSDFIHLPDIATKGKKGGRSIPLGKILKEALASIDIPENLNQHIILSERGIPMTPRVISSWFGRLYSDLGFSGCSSHSGRRTFGTVSARKIHDAGGSLRDVQDLMGHGSIQTTQRYIDSNEDAKRRLMDMI